MREGMSAKAHEVAVRAAIALVLLFTPLSLCVDTASADDRILANTCNGRSDLSYPTSPPFSAVGDIVRIRINLGAGEIQGGTTLRINAIRFLLDCDSGSPLDLNCVDEGPIVSYQGNITDTCSGVDWTTTHPVNDAFPNDIVFVPSSPLSIPADNNSFCALEFDVKIESVSIDGTPGVIEEVSGYSAADNDAVCDTVPALQASSTSSGSIRVCGCDDGLFCDGIETCDRFIGCLPGTPVNCDDGNVCTIDSCDEAAGTCVHVASGDAGCFGDTNPPTCSIVTDSGPPPSAHGTVTDNRPSEDTNHNNMLDPGEDLNGNGLIDMDTGVFFVDLEPGAVNMTLTVDPFVPGDGTVTYTMTATNPSLPVVGIVKATDGAGNTCTSAITLGTFDPFGGIVRTTTRTVTAHIMRPSVNTAGVRCVETTNPDNPDFDSIPFTLFTSDAPVDIQILLSEGDGTKIICCQFIDVQNNISPAVCSEITLSTSTCGDGTVQEGEQCDDGNTVSGDGCSSTCQVENSPPECGAARPSTDELWPPNHKYKTIGVQGVTDPDGNPVAITVTGIRQDEPLMGTGDGNTCPDGGGVGSTTASVRSERSGNLNGRVYHVSFHATDGRGGSCDGTVKVCVPHDRHRSCVDEGALYDSTGPCAPTPIKHVTPVAP